MTVETRTFWFNCGVFLMNGILLALIEGGIYFGCLFYVLPQFEDAANSGVVNAILPVAMIIGLIAAMVISSSIITWVIKKFELQDKLDQKLVNRYLKK